MKYIARDSREDLASFPVTIVSIPAPLSQLQGGNLTSYSFSEKSVVGTIPFNNNFTDFTVKDYNVSYRVTGVNPTNSIGYLAFSKGNTLDNYFTIDLVNKRAYYYSPSVTGSRPRAYFPLKSF